MAKRKNSSTRSRRRVTNDNPNRIFSLDLPVDRRPNSHIHYLNKLLSQREAEDRRLWSPSSYLPKDIYGRPIKRLQIKSRQPELLRSHPYIYRGPNLRPIRIVPKNSVLAKRRENLGTLQHVLDNRIGFENPHQVMICVRRRQRKEVLFALGLGGKGGRAKLKFRPPRRNYYSNVDC